MHEQELPIKNFKLLGLYGYKNLEVACTGPARIVIAENGTGKTTFLSALHAFLQRDFTKLAALQFDSIQCHFGRGKKEVELLHSDLPKAAGTEHELAMRQLAGYSGISPLSLRSVILSLPQEWNIYTHTALHQIYMRSPWAPEEVVRRVNDVRESLLAMRTDKLQSIDAEIQTALAGCEVLYLPTYRRVEQVLSKHPRTPSSAIAQYAIPPPSYRSGARDDLDEAGWTAFGIRFGLTDVQDRLNQLITAIQRESNRGYRVITANIIDDFLEKRVEHSSPLSSEMPDVDALALFFSRIETPGSPAERVQRIKELYESGRINEPSNTTLHYFLTKLFTVVDQTKQVERNIEQFVDKANEYLKESSDEKLLRYDAGQMKVVVVNQWTGSSVPLDDLSSGEKQVISLLSHLYLHQERKVVLIDEPELSLSIDWQKKLLPDVIHSPTCAQLLAITHSPFVFDNELDPFAGPMRVERRKVQNNE